MPQEPVSADYGDDLDSFLSPELALISIPRGGIQFDGPFEEIFKSLLDSLHVEQQPNTRAVVPCFKSQIPAIRAHVTKDIVVIAATSLRAQRQSSLRTVSIMDNSEFPYQLKLATTHVISSTLRTIYPWTASTSREVSDLLKEIAPPELFIMGEIASAQSSEKDPDDARHLAVIVREDIEPEARRNGRTVIVSSALFEMSHKAEQSNVERIFHLDDVTKRKDWFEE